MMQKVSVAALILNDKKILVVRRSTYEKFFSGYYELPGGKVNFKESPSEAVIREVYEETNLEIDVTLTFDCRSYMSKNDQQQNIEIFFLTKLISNPNCIRLSKEHDAFMWVDLNNIYETALTSYDPIKLVIERYLLTL